MATLPINAFPRHRASTVDASNETENLAIRRPPNALTSAFTRAGGDVIDNHIERRPQLARTGNGVFSSRQ
jgi:hypothetical protein